MKFFHSRLPIVSVWLLYALASTPSLAGKVPLYSVELPNADSGGPFVLNVTKASLESIPSGLVSQDEMLAAFRKVGDIVFDVQIRVASGKGMVLDRARVEALAGQTPSLVTESNDLVKQVKQGMYLLIKRIDGGHAIVYFKSVSRKQGATISWVLNSGGDAPFSKEEISALLDVDSTKNLRPTTGAATLRSLTGNEPTVFSFSEGKPQAFPQRPRMIKSEKDYRNYGSRLVGLADIAYEVTGSGVQSAYILSQRGMVLGRGWLADYADRDLARSIFQKKAEITGKELIPGTIIAVQDRGGKYAMIRVESADTNSLKFQWGYLPDGSAIFPRIEPLPDAVPTVLDVRDHRAEAQSRLNGLIYQSAKLSDDKVEADFQRALADGADVNEPTDLGYGPLLEAAAFGSKRLVELMIAAGADVDASAALHAAARAGRKDICELLLDKGADRSHRNKQGLTAFEEAKQSRRSNAEVLEVLQPEGVEGQSLHVAALFGKAGLTKQLINQGVDVNAYDSSGKTPLQLAAESGSVEVCQLLLVAGADVEKRTQIKKVYPMVLAVLAGQKDTVRVLFKKAGAEQISLAFYEAILRDHFEIAKDIFERTKDVAGLYRGAQRQIDSLLRGGHKGVYSLLISKNVVLPIWAAAAVGDTNTIKKAISEGKDLDEPSSDYWAETPLQVAVETNQYESAELLLHAGANPNVKSNKRNGDTPLSSAVDAGNELLVALLLKNKAEVDLSNDQGNTPLYAAVLRGHVPTVKLLLEAGASPSDIPALRTRDGKASSLLDKTRNKEIINLLRSRGAR